MHNVNEQLLLLFDAIPLSLAFWDMKRDMMFCNQEIVDLVGAKDKHDFCLNFAKFVPKTQPCGVNSQEKIDTVLKDIGALKRIQFDWMLTHVDGSQIPVDITAASGTYADADGVFVMARDMRKYITEQKNMMTLIEEEQQLMSMLDGTPIGMSFFSNDGLMLYCNQHAIDLLGAHSKEDYMENLFKYSTKTQRDGTPSVIRMMQLMHDITEKGRIEFDWTHVDARGKIIPVSAVGARGVYKGELGYFVYSHDNREVMAARERMRLLFDTMPLVIDYWDVNGKCIDCNQFAINFYDLEDKDEYLRKVGTLTPHVQPDGVPSKQRWKEHMKAVLKKGHANFFFVAQKQNGDLVYYEVFALKIGVGKDAIIATCSRDTTGSTKLELAIQNSEAKSKFLARMSHELRTPISVILGITEIELQYPDLSVHLDEAFAKIHESASMLLRLVNDILDLSKIESGKMEVTKGEYLIADLISDSANIYPIYKEDKPIEFVLQIDKNLPAALVGDFLRIKQILINLLSNAFKYTMAGQVEVYFTSEKLDDENVTLAIKISDTGMGMTGVQIKQMTDEYTRFHGDNYPETVGTGLGMAIVYNLVDLMNGKIDISSAVDKGTHVIIYIPQKVASDEVLGAENVEKLQQFQFEHQNVVKKVNFTPTPIPYGRILVVDDMDANLYVAKGLLSFYNLDIETSSNGYDAIEKIKSGKKYNIIFMDYMMPGINGTDTMRILRNMGYELPIIALTANALIGQAEKFLRQGFDSFISKPINSNHLDAILVKYVKNTEKLLELDGKDKKEVVQRETVRIVTTRKNKEKSVEDVREDIAEKLRTNFAITQKNAIRELVNALNSGDEETAVIKAHSLKGIAGLIHEHTLAQMAQALELAIPAKKMVDVQISEIEHELQNVISRITKNAITSRFATEEEAEFAKDVIEKLQELLKTRNAECLNMIEDLNKLPQSAIVVRQIEDYDFAQASKSLDTLKLVLGL